MDEQHLRLATGAAADTCEMNRTSYTLSHRRTSFRGVNSRPDWAIGCTTWVKPKAARVERKQAGRAGSRPHLQRIEKSQERTAQIFYSQTVLHRR